MGATVEVLQPCNKQKQAYGTEITLKYAKGNLASLLVNGHETQTITHQGKNLFDHSRLQAFVYDPSTGNLSPSTTVQSIPKISCVQNSNYVLSGYSGGVRALFWNCTTYLGSIAFLSGYFTTPTNTTNIALQAGNGIFTTVTQLEQGSVATSYEPFVPESPSFDYPAPIHGVTKITVNGVDSALPREIFDEDYFDVISAQGQAVNILFEFDGSDDENWIYDSQSQYMGFDIGNLVDISDLQHIDTSCDHAIIKEFDWHYGYYTFADTRILFGMIGGFSNAADWKSYLAAQKVAGTPVRVRAKLATPQQISGTLHTIPATMPTTITNDNGGQMSVTYPAIFDRMGRTGIAFDTTITKELMRGYELDFSIVNLDPLRRYIAPNAVFEADGQLFDIVKYHQNSGQNNSTSAIANHVSCRTNNYKLPIGYAFVGTPAAIIADMLNVAVNVTGAKASTEFSVGTCEYTNTVSFALGNTQPATLRAALWALGQAKLGFEIDYDNFSINAPFRVGADKGKTFCFGKDLASLDRDWNGTENPPTITYTVDVAVLWRIAGSKETTFGTGDTVGIQDLLIGDSIVGKRICTYKKCLDDPTKDEVVIGDFIPDAADTVVAQQVAINNSVQQGKLYNNVSIDRQNGFMAASSDGLMRVLSNGTQGFLIQHLYNGNWVTVWEADSASGKTIAYNLDHTQKVEMGGDAGYRTFVWNSTFEQWWPTGGQSTDGSTGASKIFNPENPLEYGIVGATPEGNSGLALYHNGAVFCRLLATGGSGDDATGFALILANGNFEFGANTDGDTYMKRDSGGTETQVVCKDGEIDFGVGGYWRGSVASDGVHANSASGDLPIKGATGYGDFTLHIRNGVPVGWEPR